MEEKEESFLTILPSECYLSIFSFLGLRDCVNAGATSTLFLKRTLPDLARRRRRFYCAFSSGWTAATTTNVQSSSSSSSSRSAASLVVEQTNAEKYPDVANWTRIPSALECVDELIQELPDSYELRSKVLELRNEVTDKAIVTAVSVEESIAQHQAAAFEFLFPVFRRILRAHKLYAELLSSATTTNTRRVSKPVHHRPVGEADVGGGGHDHGDAGEISLVRYVGDVLVVAALIGHSSLGIVEGSPTNASFFDSIWRGGWPLSARQQYKLWVYLHGKVLRQGGFSNVLNDNDHIPLLAACCRLRELDEPPIVDCAIRDTDVFPRMTFIYNEFGRLGPMYRGRDVVRVRSLSAATMLRFLKSRAGIVVAAPQDQEQRQHHHHDRTTETEILEWLNMLHGQSRKLLPMTVRKPVIRLDTMY